MALKKRNILIPFGQRLKAIREAAGLSQALVRHFTGVSLIGRIEAGTLSTGIQNVAILADLFGLEDHELFLYKAPLPDQEILRKNVLKYLKIQGIDPTAFFKPSLIDYIETKLLPSKFFASPRFTREVAEFFQEKYGAEFPTPQISHAMKGFVQKGLVTRIRTDKKTKFQYQRKE